MAIKYNENAMANMSILSGFTIQDIQEMIEENSSLRGYLQGYLAERTLRSQIETIPGVASVRKIPDQCSEKGDLQVLYKDVLITIEVKSLKTDSVTEDLFTQTWEGKVGIKNTDKREVEVDGIGSISTTKLIRGQFDILAICCFAVSGKWDFMFIENRFIPAAEEHKDLLKTQFTINPYNTPGLTDDLRKLFEKTLEIKALPA